jgi:ATP/maltotriose-dependent transcriptional regulator MalT/DNA-binding SARP family transcriptional activator
MATESVDQFDERPGYITKILLPRRRDDVLSRPRLIDFLNQHVDRKLLLLCAPAGYGKTTLLADFAYQTTMPVCWLSVTASDADPQVYLEYLILSIRRRFPEFGERTFRYLRTTGARDLDVVVGHLISDLHDVTDKRFVMVLDDFHHIDTNPSIQKLMNLLLDRLPANCCWVMASRTIPRVRLSRLVANREAAGLGDSDLRFSALEIQQLFNRHYDLVIPEALAEELARDAEGWIAGIILTSHSLWRGLFKGMIRGKRAGGPVFDYLATEVFDQQDPTIQTFLLESATLTRLSPDSCNALLDRTDSANYLQILDEDNLFLFRLEGEDVWYRYHPLFAEFLQSRLRTTDPARFEALHRRAGELSEREQDVSSALGYYLQASDPERAADLAERVASATIEAGRIHTLLQWCSWLPAMTLANRPRLQIFRALAAFEGGDVPQAETALESAWAASSRLQDPKLIATTLIWRSMARRMKGQYQEAIADCRDGLERAESIADTELVAVGNKQLGLVLVATGASTEAIGPLERSLAAFSALGDVYAQGVISHTLGITWKRQGEVAKARSTLDQACALWRTIDNAGMLAGTLVVLGNLQYEIGEIDEALTVLNEAQRTAHESGHLRLEGYATQTLGDVLRDRGDFGEARTAYEQSLVIAEKVGERFLQVVTLEGLGRCYLYANDEGLAQATLIRARHLANEGESLYERAICEDTHGLINLVAGRIPAAISAFEQACGWLATSGGVRDRARAHLHLGQALYRSGERERAIELGRTGLGLLPAKANDPLLRAEGALLVDLLRAVAPTGPAWLGEVVEQIAALPVETTAKPEIALVSTSTHLRSLRCLTLGRADVEIDGTLVPNGDWATQKAKELWFYLLAFGPAPREQIIEALWPDNEGGKGQSALHTTVHRVRRTLFAECVERRGELWSISTSVKIWTDDREFEQTAARLRSRSDLSTTEREDAAGAIRLYGGPYLPTMDVNWSDQRRHRLESLYLRLLRNLIDNARDDKRYEEAIAYAELYLQTDPDDEVIHESLMRSHALQGNRAAALRHYQRYAQQIRDELAAQPSRRLRLLSEQIARES